MTGKRDGKDGRWSRRAARRQDSPRRRPTDRQRLERRQLIGCAVFFCCLFAGLISYLCIYIPTHSRELFNNSYNSRQSVLAQKNLRGTIYSADGQILARSAQQEDGTQKREYPYENMFAHVVGYSDKGKTGLESLAGYYLINTSASVSEQAANQAAGRKNPGNNLVTTLNASIQEAAYQAMGIYKGAIVVMEPSTGKVLAMVSKPDFDPNQIASIWEDITADTEKNREESALLNRASQGLYPPGSTFKIVTALEYIRENPDTWEDYAYQCSGSYTTGQDTIRCFHGSVHGQIGFARSFAKSCNASFANMGMRLDRSAFLSTMEELLINQPLPVDLPYSKSQVLLTADSPDADLLQTVIGQGATRISPWQLCMITSAIANDGILMTPYEMDHIETPSGEITEQFLPKEYGRLISSSEADILRSLMTDVVEEGTASQLSGLSYTAAGKTGSAEFNGNKKDSHAWFTGFAPAESPRYAVTIIIEGIGSGGDYAVPIARRVFDACFASEGVEPEQK